MLSAYRTEKFPVTDQSCLQNLAHATGKFFFRKGFQGLHVHIYQSWLMKSTYHIFVLLEVYAGFTAYTAVYLRKQSCGDLYKINPS